MRGRLEAPLNPLGGEVPAVRRYGSSRRRSGTLLWCACVRLGRPSVGLSRRRSGSAATVAAGDGILMIDN
jgi:hypothetical protein